MWQDQVSPSRTYIVLCGGARGVYMRKVVIPGLKCQHCGERNYIDTGHTCMMCGQANVNEAKNTADEAVHLLMLQTPEPTGECAWPIESHKSTDAIPTVEEASKDIEMQVKAQLWDEMKAKENEAVMEKQKKDREVTNKKWAEHNKKGE